MTELVTIPAGEVTIADRRTSRSWKVSVSGFALGAFPVTEAVFAAALRSGGGDSRLPVTEVSWTDAVSFCNRRSVAEGFAPAYVLGETVTWDRDADGYRLPTEAEWEHACRAGTTRPRYGELGEIAWYRENSGERVHPVGGKRPNAWGLHDMLGNVWDWCWDLYDPEVYGSYRVLRGGGWFDEHWSCRAGVRRRSHPSLRIDDVGFRLARSTAG
ncbi:formylglycine-generating enzyme family protein [Paractinoplanes rhizophilus]|uniref:Formylglycine-generating enzyme family protein n=1 Tax=Paractinoplanes rhizophilus TaxID=1416877 RepID=A0ABW2HQV8_9ACTN